MIEVRIDDLAFVTGDAIVRPVNEELGAPTPLLRRLEAAAGERFARLVRVQEPLPVGAAVVTGAGDLRVELMVHAVVMSRTEPVTRDTVRRAMTSAVQRLLDWQMKEVVIAPFGLGAGNLDIEESAPVMAECLAAYAGRPRFPASVAIVAETDHEVEVLSSALRRLGL